MSGNIGVVVVFGVEVDADSDNAVNFIRTLLFDNQDVPRDIFNNFDIYYDFYVLGKGTEPDTTDGYYDLYPYFQDAVIGSCLRNGDTTIRCFRQACCLSGEWKKKIVIGFQVAHVCDVWISPKGIDLPLMTDAMVENVKLQLSEYGFPTDTKTFFILDDCISCT